MFVVEAPPPLPVSPSSVGKADAEKPAPPARRGKPAKGEETPQAYVIASWRKTRGGLFWVLFGLFWLTLIGFVPFGKMVYERSSGPLPDGPGWVVIDGYVNSDKPDSIRTTKREEINLLAYGVPVILGGLALSLGRLTCGAAPRNSGAKGLFAFSGLFTLIALAGLLTMSVCQKVGLPDIYGHARTAAIFAGGLSEFWFLLALAAAGATLRRPKSVRAVGFFALIVGLAAAVSTVGWENYLKYGSDLGRPKKPDADWLFYEEAVKMLGWLLVAGTYWRAVLGARAAIRDFLISAEDARDASESGR